MWNGTDTLYGNEWIHYDQSYFKISVAADGIYRIPYATLSAAGLPVDALNATQYQLWRLGEEQPLYTSTTGPLSDGDFLEFYGQKNRSELDRYLFRDPDNEMLNPWYSLFTDTSAYFLTWVEPGEPTLRYESIDNDLTNLPEKEEWFWDTLRVNFSDAQFSKKYDTDALVAALQSGRIYGAGLDVTDPEPLPATSPLWQLDNVIITPHVSAAGSGSWGRVALIAVENLRRYVAGEPLLYVVDMEAGY